MFEMFSENAVTTPDLTTSIKDIAAYEMNYDICLLYIISCFLTNKCCSHTTKFFHSKLGMPPIPWTEQFLDDQSPKAMVLDLRACLMLQTSIIASC